MRSSRTADIEKAGVGLGLKGLVGEKGRDVGGNGIHSTRGNDDGPRLGSHVVKPMGGVGTTSAMEQDEPTRG